jgi:16S rRNA (guanine966-N2)-methyltransferase
MRIIAGHYKGRTIRTVEGPGYRPATSKVRQALFSMLEARGVHWPETPVLDLFAGSGSLALEALSRGAPEACFVDKNPRAVASLRQTLADFQVPPGRARVLQADLFQVLKKSPAQAYALIFIDPPYGHDLLPPALASALAHGWIAEDAFVVAEVEAAAQLGAVPEQLIPQADRLYGQTRILLWQHTTQDSPSIPAPLIP